MKNPSKVKVGDLVSYNVGGQRKTSLGIVMELHRRSDTGSIRGMDHYVHIYWLRPPTMPPRAEWSDPRAKYNPTWNAEYFNQKDKTRGWYRDCGCFEVMNERA